MNQIFLYLKSSGIKEEELEQLRQNGWLPVGVDKFDDVRIDAASPKPNGPPPKSAEPYQSYRSETRQMKWDKFSALDWSKSNAELSREHGYSLGVLIAWRIRLGHPGVRQSSTKVTQEEIDAVDWENTRDIELSRKWNITRERVRQLRIQNKKPDYQFYHKTMDYIEDMKWLHEHAAELRDKTSNEIVELMPSSVGSNTKHRRLRDAGIEHRRYHGNKRYRLSDVDLELPNIVLSKIWDVSSTGVANYRRHVLYGRSPYNLAGFSCTTELPPGLIEHVKEECAKAKERGHDNEAKVLDWLENRTKGWTKKAV